MVSCTAPPTDMGAPPYGLYIFNQQSAIGLCFK
jgi:hypothetical protein